MEAKLFERPYCGLCQQFLEEWLSKPDLAPIKLHRIDVDSDTKLAEKYGSSVPVLVIGDKLVCRYFFDYEAILGALDRKN